MLITPRAITREQVMGRVLSPVRMETACCATAGRCMKKHCSRLRHLGRRGAAASDRVPQPPQPFRASVNMVARVNGHEDPRDATRGGVNTPALPAQRGRESPPPLEIDRHAGSARAPPPSPAML